MVSLEAARKIAVEEINRTYRGRSGPLVILDAYTIEKNYGWIFFYSTQKYAETCDIQHALAGNGPLIVEKADGALHRLGTGKSPEEIIREYELSHGLT